MVRNKKNILTILFVCFISFFVFSKGVIAAGCDPGCGRGVLPCSHEDCSQCVRCPPTAGARELGTFKGLGVLSEFIDSLRPDNPGPAASAFTNFISKAIGIMTVVAFIWFIFNLFIGAIGWLSSGGDKQKLQEAQKKITTNLTGLVIVISAIFLTKIISLVFNIDILDLTNFITTLGR